MLLKPKKPLSASFKTAKNYLNSRFFTARPELSMIQQDAITFSRDYVNKNLDKFKETDKAPEDIIYETLTTHPYGDKNAPAPLAYVYNYYIKKNDLPPLENTYKGLIYLRNSLNLEPEKHEDNNKKLEKFFKGYKPGVNPHVDKLFEKVDLEKLQEINKLFVNNNTPQYDTI